MMRVVLISAPFAIASALMAHAAPGDKATAQMKDRGGKVIGTITLTETRQGVLLAGEVTQLTPGPHGFHIHAVGKCEPPFTSAGSHFNPKNKKHGFQEASGSHAGDLTNLHAASDGRAVADMLVMNIVLSGPASGVLDPDGAAIVIHAKADDYRTDPAGDSGDRIACGVIAKMP
jgi:Cu-Zn family superoxide dismutase